MRIYYKNNHSYKFINFINSIRLLISFAFLLLVSDVLKFKWIFKIKYKTWFDVRNGKE